MRLLNSEDKMTDTQNVILLKLSRFYTGASFLNFGMMPHIPLSVMGCSDVRSAFLFLEDRNGN